MSKKRMILIISIAIFLLAAIIFIIYQPYNPPPEQTLDQTSYDTNADIQPTPPPETSLESSGDAKLIFVGDVMLSRYIGELMSKKNNYDFPFEKIKDYLLTADLVFGNLESPISDKGESAHNLYSFRTDPLAISGLKNAGFKVVSMANNHAFDYKMGAFIDTLDNLKLADIAYTGAGHNFAEAHAGALVEINGIKMTFLGYTNLLPLNVVASEEQAGYAYLNEAQMVKDIIAAKEKSDLVIATFHWGEEYQTQSNTYQKKIARTAVAAGADLIVGHHPHVSQEISEIDGVTVAYSLGNFVFDQNFSADTKNALLLEVEIKDKKIANITTKRIKFTNEFQPYLYSEN
ncbi:CapA family protein [Candidatus Falkowbacteria bacterium]|jgi:poly-gamma-glutamate synthesis protein (capsule biosynthesis protein)|nr:CapA family protein [Candidatus Falkowbacteria bacterium]